MAEQFYTAAATCKILNIQPYQLKRLVERGTLKRTTEVLSKRYIYPKAEVDALAAQQQNVEVLSA